MKKMLMFALLLAFAIPAAAQYNALVYTTNGDAFECQFIRQDGFNVTLRFGAETRVFNINDLAVVIFDNGFTNFYKDRDSHQMADPHYAVQKNGGVVIGMVTSFIPDGPMVVNRPGGGTFNLQSVDIARIYYNPRPFFEKVRITSNNTVEFPTVGDGDKGGIKNPGKGGRDRDNGKKDREPKIEQLAGGEVFLRMKNGGTTRGIVYDAQGRDLELVFRDGRRFRMNDIDMINYAEVKSDYQQDKKAIRLGGATMIMRNGGVIYGVVVDIRGDGEWELIDGRMIPWGQIARIYFR